MFLHSTGKKSALRTDRGYIRQTSRPPVCGTPRSPQIGFFIYTSYQINFCCNHFQSSITGHLNDALDSRKRCFSNICSHLAPAFWIMVDHQQEVPHKRAWSRFPPAQREGFSFVSFSVAYSGVRLWVSSLNWKENNVKEAGDKRKSEFPKVFSSGCQLGAAAGSSLGVCVRELSGLWDTIPCLFAVPNPCVTLGGTRLESRWDYGAQRRPQGRSGRTRTVSLNSFRLGVVSFYH